MNNNNLTCFMYSFPIPVDFVDPASGILLQAKEGGDPFLPLFAEQRGVGVSSYDYMIDI
jgi:hypothetical protein